MRFIHYSDMPVTKVVPKPQDGSDHVGTKPNGLWLSVVSKDGSDSWRDYCKANARTLGRYGTELLLNEHAILWVQTNAEIDELTLEYGYCPLSPFLRSESKYKHSAICWNRLARKYHGIVITPDCAERDQQEWYSYCTWGCPSGCVWHPEGGRLRV
jgi:hypothetical protein